MLRRMRHTNLFTTELAGPCNAARTVWNLADDQAVAWRVAVVNRAAETVRGVVDKRPTARLLIVNSPDECVIGGRQSDVEAVIQALGCEAFFLDGVVTVHCDAVRPVADAYRELHVFPTAPPPDIRFYSCALGRAYQPTSESAAQSILQQALHGFDFPAAITQAYADGVRIFLEVGPGSSCTRMIRRILRDRPHLALSVSMRGEDEYAALIKALGALLGERIPVGLGFLYGEDSYPLPRFASTARAGAAEQLLLPVGGKPWASLQSRRLAQTVSTVPPESEIPAVELPPEPGLPCPTPKLPDRVPLASATAVRDTSTRPLSELVQSFQTNITATAAVHDAFLQFSSELTRSFAETYKLQAHLLERIMEQTDAALPVVGRETGPDCLSGRLQSGRGLFAGTMPGICSWFGCQGAGTGICRRGRLPGAGEAAG
jgi:acyl transferase domain-containing protein